MLCAGAMGKRNLVLGAGFAGLWAAAGAMRKIVELNGEGRFRWFRGSVRTALRGSPG